MNSTRTLEKVHKQQRQFFILIMMALFVAGVWKSLKGSPQTAYTLFTCGIVLATLEFVFHPVAVFLFRGWMAFAHVLGKVQTTILITLIYYFAILPISLFAKRNKNSAASFTKEARARKSSWVPAAPTPTDAASYYQQF